MYKLLNSILGLANRTEETNPPEDKQPVKTKKANDGPNLIDIKLIDKENEPSARASEPTQTLTQALTSALFTSSSDAQIESLKATLSELTQQTDDATEKLSSLEKELKEALNKEALSTASEIYREIKETISTIDTLTYLSKSHKDLADKLSKENESHSSKNLTDGFKKLTEKTTALEEQYTQLTHCGHEALLCFKQLTKTGTHLIEKLNELKKQPPAIENNNTLYSGPQK